MRRFTIGFLLCLTVLVIQVPIRTYAAVSSIINNKNSSALAVTPSIVEQIVAPNTTSTFTLQIMNVINEPLPVHLSVEPLQSSGYTSDPVINWVSFNQPDIILQPNQIQSETVTLQAPANAEPGGHYAEINITPLVPVDSLKSGETHQIVRIGVMLSAIVKGQITEKESLAKFSVSANFQQSTPVNFRLTLKNNGNIHLLSSGSVTIYNYTGKKIATLVLPYTVTLPKNSSIINASWNKSWAIGYYSAQAQEVYGSHHVVLLSQKVHFWVIPWSPLAIYLILFVLLAWLIKRTRHRWHRAIKALLNKP